MAEFFYNLTQAMTKGEWEKAQAQVSHPVSLPNEGPKLRKGSQEKHPVASVESIFDGIENRVHTGKVKY